MKRVLKVGSAVLLFGLVLVLAGCGSAITATLDLLIGSVEAAVDIAAPQDAMLLQPYFNSVTTFIDQVTTELATTDSTAMKASVIAADAAKIIAPNLSGVSATVATRVAAIAPLIADIVSEVQALTAFIDSHDPAGAQAFLDSHSVKSPSAKDLAKIHAKNAALKAKIAAKTPKSK